MDRPHDPPTEPIAPAFETKPAYVPPPPPEPARPAAHAAFAQRRYRFTTGVRAGRTATIRDDHGEPILSYRSFASIVGIVAILVSAIVALAGIGAVLFLVAEGDPPRAGAAAALTIAFTFFIALLVPQIHVTLHEADGDAAVTIRQQRAFPTAIYAVATPDGTALAELRKSVVSRLGRNRWTIWQEGRLIGEAAEDGLGRALVRKIAGKFSRRFETDLAIEYGGIEAGRIIRRAGANGVDVLELTSDVLDPRVAVALAALVLGREP